MQDNIYLVMNSINKVQVVVIATVVAVVIEVELYKYQWKLS